ncbi:MAG: hypothetical protein HC769_37790 [Cyanobacteria bacterium CRU_2_1]|nr:hypothetical protein [Cyanobacteria bacterium RU_5_0]NJR64004.1 hypothetical protein [Cyanobacteria bacterium CRU_2_1]
MSASLSQGDHAGIAPTPRPVSTENLQVAFILHKWTGILPVPQELYSICEVQIE